MSVAFLGLGHMGTEMAQNLASPGLLGAVWNRSEGKAATFAAAGVRVPATATEAAEGADVVILMLADGDVAQSVAARDGARLAADRHGHERAGGGARAGRLVRRARRRLRRARVSRCAASGALGRDCTVWTPCGRPGVLQVQPCMRRDTAPPERPDSTLTPERTLRQSTASGR